MDANAQETDRNGHPYFLIVVVLVCAYHGWTFCQLEWNRYGLGDRGEAIAVFTDRKSRGRSLIDIDLNSACASELTLLPKIGPVLAERILVYRSLHGEFESIEDLQLVHGVGPKIVDAIRGIAVVQPPIFDHYRNEVLAKVLD